MRSCASDNFDDAMDSVSVFGTDAEDYNEIDQGDVAHATFCGNHHRLAPNETTKCNVSWGDIVPTDSRVFVKMDAFRCISEF